MHTPTKTISRLTRSVAFGGLLLLLAVRADADVVLSNLDGNRDGGATNVVANGTNFRGKGVAFSIADTDLLLESVTLALRFSNTSLTPVVSLYSSSGSTTPSTLLLTFQNPTITTSATFQNYTFTPASSFTLESGTTYWITVQASGSAADATMQWASSSPSLTPTSLAGLATHVTQKYNSNSSTNPATFTNSSSLINSYAVSASAIPEPSSYVIVASVAVLGLAGARRRLHRHAAL